MKSLKEVYGGVHIPKKISADLGISARKFKRIIRGEVSPTVSEITDICQYFEVSINDLDFINEQQKEVLKLVS